MIALLTVPLLFPVFQEENRVTPIVEVVRQARPAVVSIQRYVGRSRGPMSLADLLRGNQGPSPTSGSGVVIFEDGYIITNYHVVREAKQITVHFDKSDDERVYEAHLISYVEVEDLALIKIEREEPFPTVPLASSGAILGETAIAIGNPYGETHTVSTGIISGLHRDVRTANLSFTNLIQTDASINPGNSGGPLLNINGEVIGINTVMNQAAENIGFAIPVDRVRKVLREQLLSTDRSPSWHGYTLGEDDLVVDSVVAYSPAAEAGLRVGDRLLNLNGHEIESDEDYRLARLPVRPGEESTLHISRDGTPSTIRFETWSSVDGYVFDRTGLLTERIALHPRSTRYLRVTRVQESGPAYAIGVRPGDVIGAVRPPGWSTRRLVRPEDLAFLVQRLKKGTQLEVELWRDDNGDGRYQHDDEVSEVYRGVLTLR